MTKKNWKTQQKKKKEAKRRRGRRIEYPQNRTLDLGTFGSSNLTRAQKRRQKREKSWTPEPDELPESLIEQSVKSDEMEEFVPKSFGDQNKNENEQKKKKNKKKNKKKQSCIKSKEIFKRFGHDDGGDGDAPLTGV